MRFACSCRTAERFRRRCPIEISSRRFASASQRSNTKASSRECSVTLTNQPPFGLLDIQAGAGEVTEGHVMLEGDLARRIETGRATRRDTGEPVSPRMGSGAEPCDGASDVVFGTVLFGRMQSGDGAIGVVGMSSTRCRSASRSIGRCRG